MDYKIDNLQLLYIKIKEEPETIEHRETKEINNKILGPIQNNTIEFPVRLN